MKVETANCTYCGAALTLSAEKEIVKCKYCHNQVVVKNAFEFSKVEVDKSKDIVLLRANLKKYVRLNSLKEIQRTSGMLKDMIPDDGPANYYFAYAKQNLHEPKFIYDFYSSDLIFTESELEEIVKHIIENSDLRDKKRVTEFLSRFSINEVNNFDKRYQERVLLEDNYADIPRDIFVAFSNEDIDLVKRTVATIEEDGNTCWVAYRNLRPNDQDNYWENITKAIRKAKVFVVVSTKASMLSKDVQKELDIAKEKSIKLIEFKLDNSKHTTLFKHLFDGNKWVDGYTDFENGITELIKRIYIVLNEQPDIIAEEQSQTLNLKQNDPLLCSNCGSALMQSSPLCLSCGKSNPNFEMPIKTWLKRLTSNQNKNIFKNNSILILVVLIFFIPVVGWVASSILLLTWLMQKNKN